MLIRKLPAGTKAALRERANSHHRSLEAEARAIIIDALKCDPVTLTDLVSMDKGADIDFVPQPTGLKARTPEL